MAAGLAGLGATEACDLAAGTGALVALGVLTGRTSAVVPAAFAGLAGLAGAVTTRSRRRVRLNRESAHQTLRSEPAVPPAVDGAEDWPGVSPLLTPVEDFYVTDVNMRPPAVDLRRWRLAVTGAVANSLSLHYDELLDLGLVEFDAAMVCIHNRLGWNRLGNARWTGIPLRKLLAAANPEPSSTVLVTRAIDGWEASMPLRLFDELDSYVVVGLGGRALTAAHGFPARVFITGVYGQYTGAKWLTAPRLQAGPTATTGFPAAGPAGRSRSARCPESTHRPTEHGCQRVRPTLLEWTGPHRRGSQRCRSLWTTSREPAPNSPPSWHRRVASLAGSGHPDSRGSPAARPLRREG